MGGFLSKFASTSSSPEHKLKRSDLVILVMGPAGSGTASFADAAANVSHNSSQETISVPHHFDKSNIRILRTIIPGFQREVVFIIPQEFDGEYVKEPQIIEGVKGWLTKGDKDHPYADYILFCGVTNPLNVPLDSPFNYFEGLLSMCHLEDSTSSYRKLSLVSTIVPNGNSGREVPDAWNYFINKGCRTYGFESTTESARSILSKIVG